MMLGLAFRPARPQRYTTVAASDKATKGEVFADVFSGRSQCFFRAALLNAPEGLRRDDWLMLALDPRQAPRRVCDQAAIEFPVEQARHLLLTHVTILAFRELGLGIEEIADINLIGETACDMHAQPVINERRKTMPQLHAQPYDISATGFYFDSLEEYEKKAAANTNDFGNPIEEYEIQFIDGDHIDCDLAKAWGVNQVNMGMYFDACDGWDDHDKTVFIVAVGEVGYSFDPDTVSANDFDIDIYQVDSMEELAEQFVDEGLFGEIPDHLTRYIDIGAIARDLSFDYTETEVAGETLIYSAN